MVNSYRDMALEQLQLSSEDYERMVDEEAAKVKDFLDEERQVELLGVAVGGNASYTLPADYRFIGMGREGVAYFIRAGRTESERRQVAEQTVVQRLAAELMNQSGPQFAEAAFDEGFDDEEG